MAKNFKLLTSMIFKMTKEQGRSNKIVVGVLVVMLLLGGIYWLSVIEKEQYLVQRNFRLLNLWSQEIANKIESYRKVSESAFKTISGPIHSSEYSGKIAYSCQKKDTKFLDKDTLLKFQLPLEKLCDAGLTNIKIDVEKESEQKESEQKESEQIESEQKESEQIESEQKESEQKESEYSVEFVKVENNIFLRILYKNDNFKLKSDLKFSEFIIGLTNERVFDDILLIAENVNTSPESKNNPQDNAIIFQKNTNEYTWRSWNNLIKRIKKDSWLDFFSQSTVQETESTKNTLANAPHIINFESPHGDEYAAFTQPVRLSEDTVFFNEELENELYIAGIVPTTKLHQAYLTVSSTTLLLIMTALLGMVLSIPLIRLIMMGSTDALKSMHICILFFTMSLSIGLLSIFFINLSIFESSKATINKQMEQASNTIKKQLQTELTQILHTMDQFDKAMYQFDKENTLKSLKIIEQAKNESHFYPDFSLAYWMDEKGDLRENWNIQGEKTYAAHIPLMERDYVSTVLKTPRSLWHKSNENEADNFTFFVQPIVSWTTGIDNVVLSIPSSKEDRPVAALQFKFLSLMQEIIIPPGVGFSIIDNENHQVLFHSRKSRGMRENFLTEADDNPLIRDLVQVGEPGHVDGRYWAKDTHFYVTSFDVVPWTLVTYRDKELLASVSLMVLALAGGIFTAWTLLFLFVIPSLIGWIFHFNYFSNKRWLWPDQKFHAFYQFIFVLNGIYFLLGLIAYPVWSDSYGELLLIALFIYPLIILITNLLAVKKYKEEIKRREKENQQLAVASFKTLDSPMSYGLMISSFLLVFSALPAIGIMNFVYQKEITTVVKHQLFKLHQALSEADKPFVNFDSDIDLNEKGIIQIRNLNDISNKELEPNVCHTNNDPEGTQTAPTERIGLWGFYPDFFLRTEWKYTCETVKQENQNVPIIDTLYQELSRYFVPLKKGIESWGLITDSQDGSPIKWTIDDSAITIQGNLRTREVNSPEPKYPAEIQPDAWKNISIIGTADLSFRPWLFGGSWQKIEENLLKTLVYAILLIIWLGFIYKIPLYIASKTLFLFHPRRSNVEFPTDILEKLFSKDVPNLLIVGCPGQGKTKKINQLIDNRNKNTHQTAEKILIRLNLKKIAEDDWLTFIDQEEAKHQIANDQEKPDSIIIIDQFESRCNEPAINQKKLLLLETLLFPKAADSLHRHVHIISNGYPGVFPMNAESINEEKFERDEFSARWNTLWGTFGMIYYAIKHQESLPIRHKQWLEKETQSMQFQPKVREKMQEDFMRPHYQAIWQSITLDEQLALFHLARDRFVHSKHPGLNTLLCKGLIKFDPDLHLTDERFETFVRYVGKRDQLGLIEHQHKDGRWGIIKVPLGIGFLVFFMFLAVTQEEFRLIFPALISILPVFFQGMPDLLNSTYKETYLDNEK